MSLRFQNSSRIFEFLLFVKQVNYGVAGGNNSKLVKGRKKREFSNLARFHKKRLF